MNKKVFFSILIFGAFMAWLSGYNFDYRSEGVASYFFFVIGISFMASIAPEMWDE